MAGGHAIVQGVQYPGELREELYSHGCRCYVSVPWGRGWYGIRGGAYEVGRGVYGASLMRWELRGLRVGLAGL